ncbi:MAG: malto-oligosyltrehalose trehalohydrolase, partial [Syntrophaceae bacterium]|nr:malto-oligosyltrehalose trehalohydrolase [Syntrophaceae bacterium]
AHLLDLGITHVELMPVNGFSGRRGWGYDGVNLFAPHEAYGGPEGLKRLVDACHDRGLAVILDVVYNHLGPEGNYLELFGPYFTNQHLTPWGKAVNFDGPESDEVRRFVCDNALMWLRDYHMDGLRIDAVHSIMDMSAVHILEQLASEIETFSAETGRHVVVIAESALNDPRVIRSREAGGYGLDAQWNDDFHHALHTVLTGEQRGYYTDFGTLSDLALAMKEAFVYNGRYSVFRRRGHGRPVGGLPGWRFVGCIQNHDQVGNRAKGERLSRLVSPGLLKIGAALVLTGPFVPMLFQGEEWGASTPFQYFTDHGDPELTEAVRKGRRKEFSQFGWSPEDIPDPQSPLTFERSKLNWEERLCEPHQSLLDWYRRLICLRQSRPELRAGRRDEVQVTFDEKARWFCMTRKVIKVICNLSAHGRQIPLKETGVRSILLASEANTIVDSDRVFLPPESVVILGHDNQNVQP